VSWQVNATFTEARLAPGGCTCVCLPFCSAQLFTFVLIYKKLRQVAYSHIQELSKEF
jgi:hypothetical protein